MSVGAKIECLHSDTPRAARHVLVREEAVQVPEREAVQEAAHAHEVHDAHRRRDLETHGERVCSTLLDTI